MTKNLKNKECLLISLGAYGNNKLITNGKEFKNNLKNNYHHIDVFSSDKYQFYPRWKRIIFYTKEILKHMFSNKEQDIFIHMNTLKKSNVILTGSPEISSLYPSSIFTHSIVLPSLKDIRRCYLKNNCKRELVFIGRFSRIKRLDLFLEVAENAAKLKLIDGVRIIAASHEFFIEEMVYKKLNELEIKTKIYKESSFKNIYSFFQPGDIYLNMQSQCGVGKAMLEACAIGVEVIVACKELKNIIGTIDKRTLEGYQPVLEALRIIRDIVNLDSITSKKEAKERIFMASKFNVSNLIESALDKAS